MSKTAHAKDLDRAVFPGVQGGPLMHVIAAKAVAFKEALQPDFKVYQQRVVANASVLAKTIADEGFRIVSGGTDSHIVLVDVFAKGVRGKEAEQSLDKAHITVNKNAIPFDVNPPLNPSGIRLGTPALTTRGFGEEQMREVAALIATLLADPASADVQASVRRKVTALTERFPLYAWKLSAVAQ